MRQTAKAQPQGGSLQNGVGVPSVVLLLLGTLGIAAAYGMLLLLPLYVQELGGNEASFGVVLSSAAIPAVVCIGLLLRFPERLRPHTVVGLAIAFFAAGAAAASLVSRDWTPLIGIGVLLGTAWAVVYTATPMAMSAMVTDRGRATYFGYLTGTQQVGIGAGPVIAGLMVTTPLGFKGTFLIAGALALVAVVLTLAGGFRLVKAGRPGADSPDTSSPPPPAFGESMRVILRSEAVYPLVMILLFACLFTSLIQFQTTFADSRGIDHSVFYVAYTAGVIFSRFVLAKVMGRFKLQLVIAGAVTLMAAALAAFLIVGSSPVLYGTVSALVGIGYGLALPSVQAQVVNLSAEAVRPRALPLAGLVFQAAILGFPLAAGWLITTFGYNTLFVVLIAFAAAQASIAWGRYSTNMSTKQ